MKTPIKLIFSLFAACFILPIGDASASLACSTTSECFNKECGSTIGWCCPTGQLGQDFECPLGWRVSPDTSTCVRANSAITVDSIGYEITTYGSCPSTQVAIKCYAWVREVPAGTNSTQCLACGNGAIKPEIKL